MARPLRIEFLGTLYHVTARCDSQQHIFLDDKDQHGFILVLERVVSRFRLLLHTYRLMDNHFHLVVETPEANLSKAMRQINGISTPVLTSRHDWGVQVPQGRFKVIVVIGTATCGSCASTSF